MPWPPPFTTKVTVSPLLMVRSFGSRKWVTAAPALGGAGGTVAASGVWGCGWPKWTVQSFDGLLLSLPSLPSALPVIGSASARASAAPKANHDRFFMGLLLLLLII